MIREDKMSTELDFTIELMSRPKEETKGNFTNKKCIRENYNSLINSAFFFGKSKQEFEKLEDKIKLKFSYLSLIKILEDYSEDYEVDKDDLQDKVNQILKSAESYKEALREKNKRKCLYINPYQNLLLGNSATKAEIIVGYERQLSVISKMLDLQLTKKDIDPKELIETYSTFLLQMQSFYTLLNPVEKRQIDEEILINFNPNQENLYTFLQIDELSYIPKKEGNIYKMTNRFNDVILFQEIGTLGFGRFNNNNRKAKINRNSTLQNYRIKKEYFSITPNEKDVPEKEYNIFTHLDISQLTNDPEFTALHADILFSDFNLQEAEQHNGGYIGEIIQNENGKFDVYHYQEKLCACKEYEKKYKIKG